MLKDTLNPIIGYFRPIVKRLVRPLLNNRGGEEEEAAAAAAAAEAAAGKDWRADLDEGIKAHPALQKYSNKNEAVAALVAAQDLIGADKIIMPSKDATDDEWNDRVFNRLGRPKTAEEYVDPTDLNIPKEMPMDENFIKGFKDFAHKAGLLPKQYDGAFRWYMNYSIAAFNKSIDDGKTAANEATTTLRTKWGAAHDQNTNLALKVVNKFATPGALDEMMKGVGNNPGWIEMFAEIGKVLSEDQLSGKPKTLTMTPDEAAAEVAKINSDQKHPYWVSGHPEHKAAVEKMNALMAMQHPA